MKPYYGPTVSEMWLPTTRSCCCGHNVSETMFSTTGSSMGSAHFERDMAAYHAFLFMWATMSEKVVVTSGSSCCGRTVSEASLATTASRSTSMDLQ